MTPLGVGVSKANTKHSWSTPFDSFWCCCGTGVESNAKFGDTIYMQKFANKQSPVGMREKGLYVLQYVSSTVEWQLQEGCSITLTQRSFFPQGDNTTLIITDIDCPAGIDGPAPAAALLNTTISIRVPRWTPAAKVEVHDCPGHSEVPAAVKPGTFWGVANDGRPWAAGCKVFASFQQTLRLERIKDDSKKYKDWYAIMFGPTMLVGIMPTGGSGSNALGGLDPLHPEKWIERLTPIGGNLTFRATSADNTTQFILRPLNEMLDEWYTAYFDLTPLNYSCANSNSSSSNGRNGSLAAAASDLVFSGGASAVPRDPSLPGHGGGLRLRSGSPHTNTSATLRQLLCHPTRRVRSFEFTYRYVSGYLPRKGTHAKATTFTVTIGEESLYTSPPLSGHSYDLNRSNYSAPVQVSVRGLSIDASKGVQVAIRFTNHDRDADLMLPLNMSLQWS
jgi:hypothetical protein